MKWPITDLIFCDIAWEHKFFYHCVNAWMRKKPAWLRDWVPPMQSEIHYFILCHNTIRKSEKSRQNLTKLNIFRHFTTFRDISRLLDALKLLLVGQQGLRQNWQNSTFFDIACSTFLDISRRVEVAAGGTYVRSKNKELSLSTIRIYFCLKIAIHTIATTNNN